MMLMLIVFVLGGVSVLAVEAVGIVTFLWWLMRSVSRETDKGKPPEGSSCFAGDIDPSFYKKQGKVWVLESERILKALNVEKATKQHKAQKEILEVIPTQKFAKIKNQSLILIESDGSHTEIPLKGCTVAAVSASSLSTKKWAKRCPIKVESGASTVYKGSRIFYIYLETSWEKEAWCKALRLASSEDEEKMKWLAKLNVEFQNYLTSLNAAYPSFMKPSSSFGAELFDKSSKPDGSSSKVRQFLKKLAKKASKNASENKASCSSKSGYEERKLIEKARSFQDLGLASSVMKVAPTRKQLDFSNEDVPSSTGSVISDADSDDRVIGDEGSLCWNLLISRLFFDAKRNEQMKSSLQERIQRTLSNIRSPSYIGEVTCAAVNVGDLPPYVHAMRVLPSDMNELWAFEIDVQYSGGAILDLETRLEVQDLDLHEGDEASLDSSVVDDVNSDLLEGFENFSEQFKQSSENKDKMDQRNGGDILARNFSNASRSSNCMAGGSSPGSKWKSILHSVAKQVSQVPLSLGIRVASLRGTLRLYVKPPPSDQIWFGFTAMPDIDIHLNSSVGDRKISSGHLLLFITSRIKAAIRETVVLPNCENVCIPWMIAEKDDWIPRKEAPYIWVNNKSAGNAKKLEADRRSSSSIGESEHERLNKVGWGTQKSKSLDPNSLYSVPKAPPSFDTRSLTTSPERAHLKSKKHHGDIRQRKSSDPQVYLSVHMGQPSAAELHVPLLKHNEQLESHRMSTEENMQSYLPSPSPSPLPSPWPSMLEEQNSFTEDDMKPKKTSARARMHGLRKKMGEKLEEKKRHIEEKGRYFVGRMRSHKEYS
ncbi:hypothetical protein HAX54_003499 [Datura stramonium]|uniref:SMP-LTD domain-containing protein n=1 Tax=Datura stramonium TaxID=4076 RepID=A0ABS8RTH5_DATST|nr:hypothetical protein [Datura stramonium]